MPNTPCLVGECAAAFALGGSCLPEDAVLVKRIFSAVGAAFEVKEKDLNGEFDERTDIEVNCFGFHKRGLFPFRRERWR